MSNLLKLIAGGKKYRIKRTVVEAAVEGTTVQAVVVRNETGTGECQVSSGFPVPPGLVTEETITSGKIVVKVDGVEVAANVTGLRGRHNDDTFRSVLIQFPYTMAYEDEITATVTFNGAVRASADPLYIMPTVTHVQNNNCILPTSTTYLCSTELSLQKLIPAGEGSEAEELLFTSIASDWFDIYAWDTLQEGSIYNSVQGQFSLFARTGLLKYQQHAIYHALEQDYYTRASLPNPHRALVGEDTCEGLDAINPEHLVPWYVENGSITAMTSQTDFTVSFSIDSSVVYDQIAVITSQSDPNVKAYAIVSGYDAITQQLTLETDPEVFTMSIGDRVDISRNSCLLSQGESRQTRWNGIAAAYLMTGWPTFWTFLAGHFQDSQIYYNLYGLTYATIEGDQEYATTRFNSRLMFATPVVPMLDATTTIFSYGRRYEESYGFEAHYLNPILPGKIVDSWDDLITYLVDTYEYLQWDVAWIPFISGSGTVPTPGTKVLQGDVTADLLCVCKTRGLIQEGSIADETGRSPIEGTVDMADPAILHLDSDTWVVHADDVGSRLMKYITNGLLITAIDVEDNTITLESSYGLAGGANIVVPSEVWYPSILHTIRKSGTMLTSGFIGVANVTGGSFSAGELTLDGASATATGTEEEDYRNGLCGTRPDHAVHNIHPVFQIAFMMNLLMDIYLYVKKDTRIPAIVKAALDICLLQINELVEGDETYGLSNGWGYGNFTHAHWYDLTNPKSTGVAVVGNYYGYLIPEYNRAVAFVLKTLGEDTVNGKTYSQWYSFTLEPQHLVQPYTPFSTWRQWGQVYGCTQDAMWMIRQSDLTALAPTAIREPTYWAGIPSETPDYARA